MQQRTTYKSFHYRNKTTWSGGRRGLLTAPGKSDVVTGSPPEFKGEPGNWAPEELFVAALNTCMMLTFLTLAQARGVTPAGYETDADGVVEHVDGKYRITHVTVRPRVTLKSPSDIEAARTAMAAVEEHCFIANSITATVSLIPEFVTAAGDG